MPQLSNSFYRIDAEPDRNLLRIRFEMKFWEAAVVDRFFEDVIGLAVHLPDPVEALTLVDLTDAIIQSSDVIAKIQNALSHGTTGRIALVASSPLARMQTKRLQVRDGISMFPTIAAAEDWLFGPAKADAA